MARRPNTELDALIGQYEHESQRPRADEALFMLRKIGSIVKPIMRQRMWRVGTLAEFYPSQQNLLGLNVNMGQKINLRLRYPNDANQFLPFEQIVDTMLHELCHNAIGPHNAQFHSLWDQLRDEHESLVRKGYTGEGFLGHGRSLGGNRLPLHEATRLARQAAEERKKRAAQAQGSGQRLGGRGIIRGQDARSVIADAVERRSKIEKGCASGTAIGDKVAQDESIKKESVVTTQAGPEDEDESTWIQAYIDIIQEEEREMFGIDYTRPSAENPAGPRNAQTRSLLDRQKAIEQNLEQQAQRPKRPLPASSTTPHVSDRSKSRSRTVSPGTRTYNQPPDSSSNASAGSDLKLDAWTCEICTLINGLDHLTCDACTVERPAWVSEVLAASRPNNTSKSSSGRTQSSKANAEASKGVPGALKPRLNAYDNLSRFEAERAAKVANRPLGWKCGGCGNFMENEWWTCASCGRMKDAS